MSEFLSSSNGRNLKLALLVIFLSGTGWLVWANLKADPAVQTANDPVFIDAETGKVFHAKVTAGMAYPVNSPDTGKPTGYEAEFCFWTKDGHVKNDPTPVLLNTYRGIAGPTFCPDCGRLVVQHNPMAVEGHKPPPTQAEYQATHAPIGTPAR